MAIIETGQRVMLEDLLHELRTGAEKYLKFATRLCGNDVDAEDILQDAMIGAVANIHQFQGGSSLTTWICAVIRNKFLSASRKKTTEESRTVDIGAYTEEVDAHAESPERDIVDDIDRRKSVSALQAALARLSREHRNILELFYLQELSLTHVALTLGIPENTAKTRLFHARNNLRKKLSVKL